MSVPKDGGLNPKAGAKPKNKDESRVMVAASKTAAKPAAARTSKK